MKRILSVLALFLPLLMAAQQQPVLDIAVRYLEGQQKAWGLGPADIADLAVSDLYTDKPIGLTNLYLIQRHQGIEVYNALVNLHIHEGRVVHAGNRLIPRLSTRVNAIKPVLTAEQALEAALLHLGMTPPSSLPIHERLSAYEMTFKQGDFSRAPVPVKLRYQPMTDGQVRLAWDMAIDAVNGSDYWSLRIDALNGKVLDQVSWTTHCRFEKGHAEHCAHGQIIRHRNLTPVREARAKAMQKLTGGTNGTYNVFPVPVESPAHGTRTLVADPADPEASPFGWHDTDGVAGAEYTITRGNNVHAYEGRSGNFTSKGNEPNGGAALFFNFPLNPDNEPETFTDAATVNLFYMINMLHDVTHHFGFTEEAGNFQTTNYSGIGQGNDHVNGLAQFGAVNNANLNNADFSTPPDGGNGRMRMFVWDRTSAASNKYMIVDAPSEVAGEYITGTATFGPALTTTPITGPVTIVKDNTNNPTLGCQTPVDDLTGKIALIDRGTCEFGRKIVNAQNRGAIAVIICNFEDAIITMGPGAVGNQATIPSVFITASDCAKIRVHADQGLTVTLKTPEDLVGPDYLDGTLDNGIIAHEFGHGISNRLTGGPAQAGCLNGEEQMGEGWSDFFTLIMSAKDGDFAEQRRGIGTFVSREPNDGRGIRPYPYSTDLATNPFTYMDIRGVSVPHGVGAVWCSMLWDLYWAMSDEFGFDPDFTNVDAGNNKAIHLVMQGMKMQTCSPGFVDGRDAILAADQVLYQGLHQCIIWEVFARRGLGLNADQGSSGSVSDGLENFEMPDCRPELKIRKIVTPLINAGDNIEVTLTVRNDLPSGVTGVVVSDIVPEGASLVSGSAGFPFSQVGDMLFFDVGDLDAGEFREISYALATPTHLGSELLFYEPCEVMNDDVWFLEVTAGPVQQPWELQDLYVKNGQFSWGILNLDTTLRSNLAMINPVLLTGNQPVLRFSHRYNTEYRADGGFLQISTDYGQSWQNLPEDKIFRMPYTVRPMQYATFTLPNIYAFTGVSDDWVDSYADLSDYVGQEIMVQFVFGTDGNTVTSTSDGWFMDDFTVMEMFNYDTEACVTYDQGPDICARAPGRGTVVEHSTTTSTEDIGQREIRLFPNPAREVVYLHINRPDAADLLVSLIALDGRPVWTQTLRQVTETTLPIQIPSRAGGIYLVKVEGPEGVQLEKVFIQP